MKPVIKEFLLGYSGYNGGDIGSPGRPSIWCCGIEWGGDDADCDDISAYIQNESEWREIHGFTELGENCSAPYDRTLCKLLCAMAGGNVSDYKTFATEHQIWNKGVQSGHFKMNLYPLHFRNTDPDRWDSQLTDLLGFSDKGEYQRWCRLFRFPVINALMNKHQPKAVLCFGKQFEDDFNLAFSDGHTSFQQTIIDDLPVKWKFNENGTLVAVLPFPNVRRYGLQRDRSIQQIGEFLTSKLK